MRTFHSLIRYFIPVPPFDLSMANKKLLEENLRRAPDAWGSIDDPFLRRTDDIARARNRQWLKENARSYFCRWLVVAGLGVVVIMSKGLNI